MHTSDQERVFREKYNLYSKTIYKISFLYLKNNADVEDVMQEIFIKLLYKAPTFKNMEHEKAWLIRVSINICKNAIKSKKAKQTLSIDNINITSTYSNDSDYILSEILKLPTKYKGVIHLYYYEGYSVLQIAQILKITQSAVKMRLVRGRKILKLELEDV